MQALALLILAALAVASPQYGDYGGGNTGSATTSAASSGTTAVAQQQSSSVKQYFASTSANWAVAATTDGTNATFVVWSPTNPTNFSGWLGIGIGSAMAGADIVVCWYTAAGQVRISDRSGTGRVAPTIDTVQQTVPTTIPAALLPIVPTIVQTGAYFAFTRPLNAASPNLPLTATGAINMIWAYGTTRPVNGSITQHTERGTFQLTLTPTSSASTARAGFVTIAVAVLAAVAMFA